MKPLVSILIPAYNAQKWLGETLRSAVAQTWPRTEIIIVDDGSKDDTLAVAKRFEAKNVLIVSEENCSAAGARNHAFSLCQGDYIQWLDADDLLSPGKIAHQMEVLERAESKRTVASCSWGLFLYRYRHAKFVPSPLWHDLSPAEWIARKMEGNCYMQTASWLVSRAITVAAGPWDTRLTVDDDGEYFCRILLQSDYARFVPESKVYYRKAGASNVSFIGQSSAKMEAQWISMQLHIEYLRSLDDSARARAACVTYLNDWVSNFYPERPDLVQQLRQMAESLGGTLRSPTLSWKYSWIETLFGWETAKRAQISLPQLRWSAHKFWDRALFHLEPRLPSADISMSEQAPTSAHANRSPQSPVS